MVGGELSDARRHPTAELRPGRAASGHMSTGRGAGAGAGACTGRHGQVGMHTGSSTSTTGQASTIQSALLPTGLSRRGSICFGRYHLSPPCCPVPPPRPAIGWLYLGRWWTAPRRVVYRRRRLRPPPPPPPHLHQPPLRWGARRAPPSGAMTHRVPGRHSILYKQAGGGGGQIEQGRLGGGGVAAHHTSSVHDRSTPRPPCRTHT